MKKTILVTGASGNLGHAVIQVLLQQGYRIIALDATAPRNEYVEHQRILPIQVDLSDEKAVNHFVAELKSEVDAAILTVGGFRLGAITETSNADIRKMIGLNFETAYCLVRPLLARFMKRGEGQFFLIGARPALDHDAGKAMVAYALSKSLVFALSDLINAEGKGTNVHSSVIVPSTLDTPQNRNAMPDAAFADWVPPARIAETIAFLLTDAGAMQRESIVKIYHRA